MLALKPKGSASNIGSFGSIISFANGPLDVSDAEGGGGI